MQTLFLLGQHFPERFDIQPILVWRNQGLCDWFLNLPEGLPFFQEILQKGVTDDKIEAVFTEYIAAIEGVITLESFEIITDPKTRKVRINFRARTKDGVLDYSKTVQE